MSDNIKDKYGYMAPEQLANVHPEMVACLDRIRELEAEVERLRAKLEAMRAFLATLEGEG